LFPVGIRTPARRTQRGRRIKRLVFVHLARAYWENLGQTRRLPARLLPDIPHFIARDEAVAGF